MTGPQHYAEAERLLAEADTSDREFTQHARTDVPDLVARVRELEKSVRVHRESITRLDSIKSERGARIVELEEENQKLRDVLENVSCAGTLDEVSDALDKANDI